MATPHPVAGNDLVVEALVGAHRVAHHRRCTLRALFRSRSQRGPSPPIDLTHIRERHRWPDQQAETLGDEVTWRARHFGVWFTLTSRITAYDRPKHFRDRMVRGPLARLDHSHEFAADRQGGTAMRDVFDFAAPAGPLGRVVEVLFLNAYFKRFVKKRHQILKAVAESDAWRQFIPSHVDR